MNEIDKDKKIEADLWADDLWILKKKVEELKNKFETEKNNKEIADTSSIDLQISNLEHFVLWENTNIDQAKDLLSEITNQIEKQKNKLDSIENIPKDHQDNNKQNNNKFIVDISSYTDQKEIDQIVTQKADIVREDYNKQVQEDVIDIWEKVPWLKRLTDRAV